MKASTRVTVIGLLCAGGLLAADPPERLPLRSEQLTPGALPPRPERTRFSEPMTNSPGITNATNAQSTLQTNASRTNRTLRIPSTAGAALASPAPVRFSMPPPAPPGLPPRLERIPPPLSDATNIADPYERQFHIATAAMRSILANTNLDAVTRAQYEKMVEGQRESIFFHKTNVQLWADIHEATRMRDPEAKARAQQELASLLLTRLEKTSGKTYPTNLSLKEVIQEMKNAVAVTNSTKATK